jgi:hypothetical protein
MGFTPEQIGRMTVWELNACLDGYQQAHGGGKVRKGSGEGMSEDRARELGIEGFS